MDNLSYLNQISNDTQPTEEPKKSLSSSLLSNKTLKIFLIVAGVIIVLSIIFSIVMNILNHESDYIPRLKIRATNISTIVKDYNPKVKSSTLRAAGSSLSATLDNINSTVPAYISKDYKAPEPVANEEKQILANMSVALEEAKINGYLDRTYARQLAYAVGILIALETEAYDNTNNSSAKAFLTQSKESLNTILPAFSEYSDTAK